MKTTVTIEVDMPDGYEFVAWRVAGVNDEFLHEGRVLTCCCRTPAEVVIVRRVAQWRDATIDDLKRAPLQCRVRDLDCERWFESELKGWRFAGRSDLWRAGGEDWNQCQVKD